MFDAKLRPLIDPPLNRAGQWLAVRGVKADQVSWVGFALGLLACLAVSQQFYGVALLLLILNRVLDGLDGAVARATSPSDWGGFLDIILDFIFYAGFVLAFALAAPQNALSAAVLLTGFFAAGGSFLAFAIIAAKRNLATEARGKKSFFHSLGVAEGGETIGFFILMCLLPQHFGLLAYIFAALCVVTLLQRLWAAAATFRTAG